MSYQEFVKAVETNILDYFPAGYENAHVELRCVPKLNKTKDAISVYRDEDIVKGLVYLDDLYTKYLKSNDLVQCMKYAIDQFIQDIDSIGVGELDVSTIKDNTVVCLINS